MKQNEEEKEKPSKNIFFKNKEENRWNGYGKVNLHRKNMKKLQLKKWDFN